MTKKAEAQLDTTHKVAIKVIDLDEPNGDSQNPDFLPSCSVKKVVYLQRMEKSNGHKIVI